MKRYLLSVLLLAGSTVYGFKSLNHARSYAAQLPEFPVSDSDDLETPDFTSFYRSLQPSWWQRLIDTLGLARETYWNPTSVLPLLKKVQTQYAQKKDGLEQQITINPDTHLIVIGGVHGAFHSLVRIVSDLKRKGHITNNLMLRPDTYLIFIGDAIDYAAYSLETIGLILTLMQRNPEQVIYIT